MDFLSPVLSGRVKKRMDGGNVTGTDKNSLEKIDIGDLNFEEMQSFMLDMGQKAFRGRQLYQWIHGHLACSFEEMTNLPKDFRQELAQRAMIAGAKVAARQVSKDGTSKFLFELSDGNFVESVLMKYKHGNSVCISTQVGCRMGCRFCASTVGGLVRNLRASEMLAQVYGIQRISGERISNVILMGIGEPLDNYDNVVKFVRMVSDEYGLNISQRNLTISTCGLTEKIRELAKEDLAITLAISLHAPNDALRQEMMPVAVKYPLAGIIDACRYYIEKTGRRVTFEYSMVQGKNDSLEEAEELCRLVQGMNCHVNLIPLNPVEGRMGQRSGRGQIEGFRAVLEKNHVTVTVRRELGRDIDAACGQLRQQYSDF